MTILCEGPRCNAGRSAKDREREITAQFPSTTSEMRDEGAKHARAAVSHALAHTEH
jgi:hypothetical protein